MEADQENKTDHQIFSTSEDNTSKKQCRKDTCLHQALSTSLPAPPTENEPEGEETLTKFLETTYQPQPLTD
jgi:hypothetical protein